MDELKSALAIAAQGMRAQGTRMKVISENVANAGTTAETPGGDPYRRQIVSFKNEMNRQTGTRMIEVDKVLRDQSDFALRLDPSHPAADENGFVKMPNVNPLIEMTDMREAQRSYEANLGVVDLSKSMLSRTIDLLRN